ncbi:trypsin CFT-1-like [Cydia pomonella]|uniref:trypsin CFT-1-like n=1 Tax=Cydia pomonella TaxID=82600 RepID=UPI002ADE7EFB|nr:trypsin CFT-1-like [Cydia pomonella]
MRVAVLLLAVVVAVSALPRTEPPSQRIVGGSVTTIENYPFQAALLASWDLSWYSQSCGATILNNRSILTAAHCYWYFTAANRFRVRVGSTFANSGGVVHTVSQNILHPSFNRNTLDNDIAIVRLATTITFNNQARAGSIAGTNYNVADNQAVWAVGWGATSFQGPASETLRHVQIWTVNQAVCVARYAELRQVVTDNMLCSGWLDVGGRDQCQGDSGGPLIHNGVVIGVCSWGEACALARYPGVNARVSRYTAWIQANA